MQSRFLRFGALATLVTIGGGLLWQTAWNQGRQTAFRRVLRPTPSPDPLADPAKTPATVEEYAGLIDRQVTRGRAAMTADEQKDAAQKLYQLGQSAHFRSAGGGALSLKAYNEALALLRKADDRTTEADVLANLSDTQQLLGRIDDAEASLRAAVSIREAGIGASTQLADLLNRLGDLLRFRGKYRDAHRVLDRALGMEEISGEVGQQADCLRALGQLAIEEGQLSVARQLLKTASWKYYRKGMVESRAALWGQLGDISLMEGKIEEADSFYAAGLKIWQERKQDFWTGRFLARQAMVALARNDTAAAKRLAAEARALLEASNGPVSAAWAIHALGEAARRDGDLAEARTLHQEALQLRRKAGYVWAIQQSEAALARCDTAQKM